MGTASAAPSFFRRKLAEDIWGVSDSIEVRVAVLSETPSIPHHITLTAA